MPVVLTDWLTGRTVIQAENRALRPNEFVANETLTEKSELGAQQVCPFCPGREAFTPPDVYLKTDLQGRWQVRVVANMYPAVTLDESDLESAAIGVHEVIIETPRHVDRMSALTVVEIDDVLTAYAARLDHWHSDGRFTYGLVFKNQGRQAGASLSHLHSQLIALADVPVSCAAESGRAAAFRAEHGLCGYCRLIQQERSSADRVIWDGDDLIAFCPRVSLHPCEIWILPTQHEPWFERRPTDHELSLAGALQAILARVEAVVPTAAYNLVVRTAPWNTPAESGHWRIEILPRMNSLAGFELATGIHINAISPAEAAKRLRSS